MLIQDTAFPSVDSPAIDVRASDADPRLLAGAFVSLDIEPSWHWAFDNYKRVVRELSISLGARQLIEIGGGRDPLFDLSEVEDLGVGMTINDIVPAELAMLPHGYKAACFDVTGETSRLGQFRGNFDLAFSRMVFEHVADGRRAWTNLYDLLTPGGVALTFIPTLYALPFVVNWFLPHKLAATIVRKLDPSRHDGGEPVFPAVYSWCLADEARMQSMLSAIGYREIVVKPFYGHAYYRRFPIIRDVHEWCTSIARRRDWRTIATFAYIAARK